MPRCYWCSLVAFVGCVAALKAEARDPVTKNSSAVTTQDQRRTAQQYRAEKHDYSDLRAQWEAAYAARSVERATWYQTWIAAVGVVLLLATLWVTMLGSRRQLRAYVYLADSDKELPKPITRDSRLTFAIKNSGLTQALNVTLRRAAKFVPRPIGDSVVEWEQDAETIHPLPPSSSLNIFVDMNELSDDEFARFARGEVLLWRLRIEYRTVFWQRDFDEHTLVFSAEEMSRGCVAMAGQQERDRT
jgi:hypothetical protein